MNAVCAGTYLTVIAYKSSLTIALAGYQSMQSLFHQASFTRTNILER